VVDDKLVAVPHGVMAAGNVMAGKKMDGSAPW
jgi:hypothetical protein